MLQERRLAILIAHGAVAFGLHLRDLPRQSRPLAKRRDEYGIDIVEALSHRRQILHRHKKLRTKQNRRPFFGSGGLFEVLGCSSSSLQTAALPRRLLKPPLLNE